MKDFYKEIDKCLTSYETHGELPIEQIHSLADRTTTLFEEGYL